MWEFAAVLLYHRQMLIILVRREQHLTRYQLTYYTTYRPYITLLIPLCALQYHLRRTVLSRVYYRTVVIIVLGSPSKINNLQLVPFRQVVVVQEPCL